jgi:DNA-binding CsgD family transcriptional regulator
MNSDRHFQPCSPDPIPLPKNRSDTLQRLASLTAREREVLGWVMQGKRNSEIASILSCSVNTIHKHVLRILKKLGVETRTAATHRAMEAGFRLPEIKE